MLAYITIISLAAVVIIGLGSGIYKGIKYLVNRNK